MGARRLDSFTSLPVSLMSQVSNSTIPTSHSGGSFRSSLHSMPGLWDPDRTHALVGIGGNGVRASYTSSEVRRLFVSTRYCRVGEVCVGGFGMASGGAGG